MPKIQKAFHYKQTVNIQIYTLLAYMMKDESAWFCIARLLVETHFTHTYCMAQKFYMEFKCSAICKHIHITEKSCVVYTISQNH